MRHNGFRAAGGRSGQKRKVAFAGFIGTVIVVGIYGTAAARHNLSRV